MKAIQALHKIASGIHNPHEGCFTCSHFELHDFLEAIDNLSELVEAADAVAYVQINRRTVSNDLGKAKQLRLRAALAKVKGVAP